MEKKNKKQQNGMNGATLGSQTLTIATNQAIELLANSDEMIANGLIRTEKALKKHRKEVTKKGVNLLVALGAKVLTTTFAPDTLVDKVADIGVAVTGISAGLTARKVAKTAMCYSEEEIKAEREARLLAAIAAEEEEDYSELDDSDAF